MSETPFVVKATNAVTQAEKLAENGKLEEAIEKYHQAAELFLLATNHATDSEVVKSLKLLSSSQTKKINEMQVRINLFKKSGDQPKSPRGEISVYSPTSSHGDDDDFIFGSPTYFVDQSSEGSLDEVLLFKSGTGIGNFVQTSGPISTDLKLKEHPEEKALGSSPDSLHQWLERMLQILPNPFVGSSKATELPIDLRNSTLQSSFYFVPEVQRNNGNGQGGILPRNNSSNKLASEVNQIQAMELKIQQLTSDVMTLKEENDLLKSINTRTTKENDALKQRILYFRQEFQKKAHQLRSSSILPSHSVGHLPSILDLDSSKNNKNSASSDGIGIVSEANAAKLKSLEVENLKLQREIQILTEKNTKQADTIEKYDQKWENLKEEARKRRNSKSLTSSGMSSRSHSSDQKEELSSVSTSSLFASSKNLELFEVRNTF